MPRLLGVPPEHVGQDEHARRAVHAGDGGGDLIARGVRIIVPAERDCLEAHEFAGNHLRRVDEFVRQLAVRHHDHAEPLLVRVGHCHFQKPAAYCLRPPMACKPTAYSLQLKPNALCRPPPGLARFQRPLPSLAVAVGCRPQAAARSYSCAMSRCLTRRRMPGTDAMRRFNSSAIATERCLPPVHPIATVT